MHAAAGRPGPASDCVLRRWQEDRLGSGGLRKEDFAASIAENVLLRGQFPHSARTIQVDSSSGVCRCPSACCVVGLKLFTLYSSLPLSSARRSLSLSTLRVLAQLARLGEGVK